MASLEHARKEITEIDTELAALFEKRMRAVREVAEYKMENGLPVIDEAREAANIERTTALLADPSLAPYFREWYKKTMEVSRNMQTCMMEEQRNRKE